MKEKTTKKYTFKSEGEREVGVCIAIQKIGFASNKEIIEKITLWGGKISEKQVDKCAENLRRRGLLSIDFTTKEGGVSVKKYAMKSIKLSIPEVAQIKDIVDDASLNPLKEELDRSKKTMKKGLKNFDYYLAEVEFTNKGDIQGFIPDKEGIVRHYKANNRIVFHQYHFKNWFRANLPLINRSANSIGDIKFQEGEVITDKECIVIEKFITNIESGFSGSNGTGGRGVRKVECLPIGSIIKTSFAIPRELIHPDKFIKALEVMTTLGSAFGGGAKLSTGKLIVKNVKIVKDVLWSDE